MFFKENDMTEKEHELKFMASRADIERLRGVLSNSGDVVSQTRAVQINFYYDTEDMSFLKSGVTVRIRQKAESLRLEIKERDYYGKSQNRETSRQTDKIPQELEFGGKLLRLKGQLVTDRTRFVLKNGANVDLDINFYCGKTDYELEIELPEGITDTGFVRRLSYRLKASECGKVSRFFKALNESEAEFTI
jgi:uncharacterized protein YjbK